MVSFAFPGDNAVTLTAAERKKAPHTKVCGAQSRLELLLDAEHPAAAEGDAGERGDEQDTAAHGPALQKQQFQGAGPSIKVHVPLQQRHDQDVDKVDAISVI